MELVVDPSERRGYGPASYRMSRNGELVWGRAYPYTFLEVVVFDDGSAAGYGYPGGEMSGDELVIAAFEPEGDERWMERVQRGTARMHAPPDPYVREVRRCPGGFALELSRGFRKWTWSIFDVSKGFLTEQREAPPGDEREAATQLEIKENIVLAPSIELAALGHVVFPWSVPAPETGVHDERRYRQPHRVYVDGLDRVWISEFSSRVVHCFDSSGHPLHELTPDPKAFRPYRPVEWMSLRGDGHLLVCGDRGVEEFDPAGVRVRRTAAPDSPPRWLFLPGTKEHWSVEGTGRIDLFDAGGKLQRTLDRGANGRWFQGYFEAAVAPDGSLAALDEPNPYISSRDPSTWVQLIAATGEARRSLRVPAEFYEGHIAYDGRRIALVHGRALLLLNEDGSAIGRMTLPEEVGEPYYLFITSSGDELWIFPHMRHEMFRLAMP